MEATTHREYIYGEWQDLVVLADWAQAASPIWAIWLNEDEPLPDSDDERWFGTPYQVADARHDPGRAARLVAQN